MIEVFKTNVVKSSQAQIIVNLIQRTFAGYSATFDLEDCDKVLCVKSPAGEVCAKGVVCLLRDFGYDAEVLGDENVSSTPALTNMLASIYH